MLRVKVGTLLFDEKQQYPGIVTSFINENMVNVRWYKWGYKGPDFMDDWALVEATKSVAVTENHHFFRRHGLPPEYVKPDRRSEIEYRLQQYVACIVADYEVGDSDSAEMQFEYMLNYVMEQIDNGR